MWNDALKAMKKNSGLTTTQIAEQSGIPEPTLEKLFAGATKEPKLETMRQLVHFLGYSLDDLYPTNSKKAPSLSERLQHAGPLRKAGCARSCYYREEALRG